MSKPKYSPEKEFETLRNELLQGKKYVFERPIIIITGGIALLQLIDKSYVVYFPLVFIGLLSFNLWFTINRMNSIARIVAYIQIVLEDEDSNWHGWETSLRNYRKWLKRNKNRSKDFMIEESNVYDNLGYFPTIYYLHLIGTSAICSFMINYTINHYSKPNVILMIMTILGNVLYLIYALINRPKTIKPQIERNRQIWINVFHDWENLN